MSSVRLCENCGNPVPESKPKNARFCCSQCQATAYKRALGNNTDSSIPVPLRAAISEYRACLDLMERGYEVYRGINPFCKCDLVAIHGDHTLRIEVKTGMYNRNREPYRYVETAQRRAADVIALVMADGAIFYQPDLPTPNPA